MNKPKRINKDYEALLTRYNILDNQNKQLMERVNQAERETKKYKKAYYDLIKVGE